MWQCKVKCSRGSREEKRPLAAEKEAKKEARRAAERAAARVAHLGTFTGSEEKLWQQVEEAIAAKQPKEYGRPVTILKDLRDLAARSGCYGVVLETRPGTPGPE